MQSERLGDISLEGKPLAVLGPVLRLGGRAVEYAAEIGRHPDDEAAVSAAKDLLERQAVHD